MLDRDRSRRKRVRTASQELWDRLCEAHRLTFAERRTLKRAARELGVANPLLFFFRPSAFTAYLKDRKSQATQGRREQMRRLVRILFADQPPEHLTEGTSVGDDGLPHCFAPDELDALPEADTACNAGAS